MKAVCRFVLNQMVPSGYREVTAGGDSESLMLNAQALRTFLCEVERLQRRTREDRFHYGLPSSERTSVRRFEDFYWTRRHGTRSLSVLLGLLSVSPLGAKGRVTLTEQGFRFASAGSAILDQAITKETRLFSDLEAQILLEAFATNTPGDARLFAHLLAWVDREPVARGAIWRHMLPALERVAGPAAAPYFGEILEGLLSRLTQLDALTPLRPGQGTSYVRGPRGQAASKAVAL